MRQTSGYLRSIFNSLPPEARVRQCKGQIKSILNKMDTIDSGELSAYVDLIVDGMDKEQLAALEKAPRGFAMKLKDKIDSLLTQHCKETFKKWLDTEENRLPRLLQATGCDSSDF